MGLTSVNNNESSQRTLPLLISTPTSWAVSVLKEPLILLNDHAHLERKASQNALALLHQWPEGKSSESWTKELTEISRDESQHLALVIKILNSRDGELSRSHTSTYALALKKLIRVGTYPGELVDKLLVSSLIEARSCERFLLLSQSPSLSSDVELKKLYHGLWSSEHDHYLVFLSLAYEIASKNEVDTRWQELLIKEGEIIQNQKADCTMHSWI